MTSGAPWYAGFDVGGTRVKCVAMTVDGRVLDDHTESSAGRSFDEMVAVMLARGGEWVARFGPVTGIGIATPGIVRMHDGPVSLPGRLGGSEGYPVVERLSSEFACPVVCINDGDAAALGEHRFGAGRGAPRLVLVTLGTGIGGGIVIDGRLMGDLVTGEGSYLGHIVQQQDGDPCLCGNRGCAETLVSANAVVGRLRAALQREIPSSLLAPYHADPASIGFPELIAAARDGDGLATEVFARFRTELATYLVSLAHLIGPTTIVLGGGVMHGADAFLPEVAAEVQSRQFRAVGVDPVRVVRAHSLDLAGATGACVPLLDVPR